MTYRQLAHPFPVTLNSGYCPNTTLYASPDGDWFIGWFGVEVEGYHIPTNELFRINRFIHGFGKVLDPYHKNMPKWTD